MKLADDITIRIGGEAIVLRPSLRFAIRLQHRPGSFAQFAREVTEGSLSAACEIIRDHYDHPMLETRVFDAGPDRLMIPLMTYIMGLTGIDPDTPQEKAGDTGGVPFGDYLANLYRIGTGWLGWSPETTLDATPAEITEAYQGRMEMLKSIFGGEDDTPAPKPAQPAGGDWGQSFAFFARARNKAAGG